MKPETRQIKNFLTAIGMKNEIYVRASTRNTRAICEIDTIYFNKQDYSPELKTETDKIFKILAEKNLNFDIHFATFSILHEIGHILAAKKYDDYDKANQIYADQYIAINIQHIADCETISEEKALDKLEKAYREINMEKDADREAYELYKKFYKEVHELENEMKVISKA